MLEYLPWILSSLALVLAAIPLPGFARVRLAAVFLAMGAGQIHLAVLGLLLLLLIDNNWRIAVHLSGGAMAALAALALAIVLLTVTQETDLRTWSELAQLALYLVLFFLAAARLGNGRDMLDMLVGAALASLGVALLALALMTIGWVSPPDIFVDRGANEASVFLALMGVVPCAVLLSRTRNPLWLAAAAPMVLAQYLATSRGSMAVSGVVLLVAVFLWTRSLLLRSAAVAGGLGVLGMNLPQVLVLFDAQLNSSARERMALFDYGMALADERFWTGWGWGSTSRLASMAPNTVQTYPHFHNAYVQMIVELGVLGWLVIGIGGWLCARWAFIAAFRLRQPGVTALVACSGLGIATSCLFDAMLLGADRTVQLIILLALSSRAVALAQAVPAARRLRERPPLAEAARVLTAS